MIDRKFEELYKVDDYEILTDTGWRDVRMVGKTIQYDVWLVKLENGKKLLCANDHILFKNGIEVFVKDLNIGDYIDVKEGQSKVIEVKCLEYKENMYDVQVDGERYYSNNILSHNTTTVAVYVLWFAIFHSDKNIGIVSNKESSAKMILARLKRMYECLPVWLKPGVTEYSKTFTTFDNGTRIIISATSADAFRGEAMSLLCCDEFAFVPGHQAEEFWASNYPTISASKKAKIIIISTPCGLFNIFHRLWSQSKAKLNTFVNTRISWEEVPGRDKKWAEEQIKNLGQQKFNQEFAVKFIGSTNTVINAETIKVLMTSWEEPLLTDLQDRLQVWEKPVEGASYIMGVDPAKGTGQNWSTIQILKLKSINPIKIEQVAVFRDNLTDVYEFSEIVSKMSYYYNNSHIMCENNGEGSAVVQRLWWDIENPNLVNSGSKTASLGIRANTKTKPKAVLLMKKLIEDGSVKLVDKETIEELGSFIEEGTKFFGKDKPDDLVSALYWGFYVLEMNVLDESYGFIEKKEDDDIWSFLGDVEDVVENWEWLTNSSVFD